MLSSQDLTTNFEVLERQQTVDIKGGGGPNLQKLATFQR